MTISDIAITTSSEDQVAELFGKAEVEAVQLNGLINVPMHADMHRYDDDESGLLWSYCKTMERQLQIVQDLIYDIQTAL